MQRNSAIFYFGGARCSSSGGHAFAPAPRARCSRRCLLLYQTPVALADWPCRLIAAALVDYHFWYHWCGSFSAGTLACARAALTAHQRLAPGQCRAVTFQPSEIAKIAAVFSGVVVRAFGAGPAT